MIQLPSLQQIRTILQDNPVIAVVGLSPRPERPSNQVARYMLSAGYRIIPVNPGQSEILGEQCYPDLCSIPEDIDIVNIFRRADQVLPIVQDAIAKKAKVVWMQEGIVNETAAKLAVENGLTVIMDRCIQIDHQQFLAGPEEV